MLHLMTDTGTTSGSVDQIGQLLGSAAMLFVLFMVIAVVAEQILEHFRGTLERFGITGLRGGVTMEQAMAKAQQVLSPADYQTVQGVRAQVEAASALVIRKSDEVVKLRDNLAAAVGPNAPPALQSGLDALAASVRRELDAKESRRIYILRWLTLGICLLICVLADINAFELLGDRLGGVFSGAWLKGDMVAGRGVGHLATAIAASAGSQYWHDVLDRVRAAKTAVENARAVATV